MSIECENCGISLNESGEEFQGADNTDLCESGTTHTPNLPSHADWSAVLAYMYLTSSLGENFDQEEFDEAYAGHFGSDEDFARNLADDLGLVDANATWPNNCIDWEHAANELMHDYNEHNGYYFRNI